MENRGVLIGSIVFVFGAFALMISLLVYESYKANQMKALALSIKTEARPAPSSAPSLDYSMYKTKIGDEGREMVQIPEGRSQQLLWEVAAQQHEQIRYLRPQRSTLEEVFLKAVEQP